MKVFISCPSRSTAYGIMLWEQLKVDEVWYFNSPFNRTWEVSKFRNEGFAEADIVIVVITNDTSNSVGVATEVSYALNVNLPILGIKVSETIPTPPFLVNTDIIISTNFAADRNCILEAINTTINKFKSSHSVKSTITTTVERVFIAYSRKQRQIARILAEMLREKGKPHFWDAKIYAGAKWRQTIQRALDDCTHVIVIWTTDAAQSDEVEREVSYALAKGKAIIPILSKDIPELPYHLYGLQYIVFDDNDLSIILADVLRAINNIVEDDIWQ